MTATLTATLTAVTTGRFATAGRHTPPILEGSKRPAIACAALAPNKLSATAALARLMAERDTYFVNAHQEVDRNVREVLAQEDAPGQGLRVAKLVHGRRDRREIALTFDDGPHPQYTPALLRILKQNNVPATFFLVGEQAEKYPELVRAEASAGHSIANHTYHHVSLPRIPQAYVADEIKACGKVLQAITGKSPRLFRPPGGEYNQEVGEASEALGYVMTLWTDDPGDYASPGEEVILNRTLSKARNGGIILVHDGIQQTVNVLPRLISTLKAKGYTFVTVDQMLAERAAVQRAKTLQMASAVTKNVAHTRLPRNFTRP